MTIVLLTCMLVASVYVLQELKQQNLLLSETKILLQDEVTDLHSRLERLSELVHVP